MAETVQQTNAPVFNML